MLAGFGDARVHYTTFRAIVSGSCLISADRSKLPCDKEGSSAVGAARNDGIATVDLRMIDFWHMYEQMVRSYRAYFALQ